MREVKGYIPRVHDETPASLQSIRKALDLEVEPRWRHEPPVFVIGCMRSGTTLLADKLSQHPQLLRVGNELQDVWGEIAGAPCGDECPYRGREHLTADAVAGMSSYFTRFIAESRRVRRHLMRIKKRLKQMPGRVFYDWDRVAPLHKSTHLVNKIEFVHAMFPRARILFIVRNIHAQAASMKLHLLKYARSTGRRYLKPDEPGACWSVVDGEETSFDDRNLFPEQFSVIPEMWMRLNRLAVDSAARLPDNTLLPISYERLVTHQEDVIGNIFRFLSLDDRQSRKAGYIARRKVKPYNMSMPGDPLTKWQEHLTQDEVDAVNLVLERESESHQLIRRFFRY